MNSLEMEYTRRDVMEAKKMKQWQKDIRRKLLSRAPTRSERFRLRLSFLLTDIGRTLWSGIRRADPVLGHIASGLSGAFFGAIIGNRWSDLGD